LKKQKGLTGDKIEKIMGLIPNECRSKWEEKIDKDGKIVQERSYDEVLKTLVKGCCNMKKTRTF